MNLSSDQLVRFSAQFTDPSMTMGELALIGYDGHGIPCLEGGRITTKLSGVQET